MSFSQADIQLKMSNKGMLYRQMSLRGWNTQNKMKGEPLEKPPPLLLPQKDHARNLQGRAISRSQARYDNFTGILKRVQDMKINMDTEETTTESESSSVRTRSSRGSALPFGSGSDEPGSPFEDESLRTRTSSAMPFGSGSDEPGSPFEDESSASDVTGSDQCPPYEKIPTSTSRYSCTTVTSSTQFLNSFRDGQPCKNNPIYSNQPTYSNEPINLSRNSCSSSSIHLDNNNEELVRRRGSCPRPRPASLYSNTDSTRQRTSSYSTAPDGVRRPSSVYSNGNYGNSEPDYSNTHTENTPMYSNSSNSSTTDFNENTTVAVAPVETTSDLTQSEIRKIEMFFRGLRTEIWVSTSLANMYVNKTGKEGSWTFKHVGVPVLVLESGDTKSRSKRRIQIILAERGSCFPLWKDVIDNLSSYRKANKAFHTMHLSSDHQQIIGLSFDSSEEADRLLATLDRLTADPENINICVPGAKKKNKIKTKEKKSFVLPSKKQISAPCLFEHVTSVAAKDQPIYMSLKTLLDRGMKKPQNMA